MPSYTITTTRCGSAAIRTTSFDRACPHVCLSWRFVHGRSDYCRAIVESTALTRRHASKRGRDMTEIIAGVRIPDSALAQEATQLIRDTTNELIFHHSRRVFLFGSLQSRRLGIAPDLELQYVAALFHDTGLVAPYRGTEQRFELDGADTARGFLTSQGFSAA